MSQPYEYAYDDSETVTDRVTIDEVLETLERYKRSLDDREKQLEVERIRLFIYDAFGMNDILREPKQFLFENVESVIAAIDPEKQDMTTPGEFEDTRGEILQSVNEMIEQADELDR